MNTNTTAAVPGFFVRLLKKFQPLPQVEVASMADPLSFRRGTPVWFGPTLDGTVVSARARSLVIQSRKSGDLVRVVPRHVIPVIKMRPCEPLAR